MWTQRRIQMDLLQRTVLSWLVVPRTAQASTTPALHCRAQPAGSTWSVLYVVNVILKASFV